MVHVVIWMWYVWKAQDVWKEVRKSWAAEDGKLPPFLTGCSMWRLENTSTLNGGRAGCRLSIFENSFTSLFPNPQLHHMPSASRILPNVLCFLESPCCPHWLLFNHDCPLFANDTEIRDCFLFCGFFTKLWKGSACSWNKQLLAIET